MSIQYPYTHPHMRQTKGAWKNRENISMSCFHCRSPEHRQQNARILYHNTKWHKIDEWWKRRDIKSTDSFNDQILHIDYDRQAANRNCWHRMRELRTRLADGWTAKKIPRKNDTKRYNSARHTISGIYVWQYPTHIQFISYNAVRMPCRRWMVDIDGFSRIEEWNIFWTTASTRKRSGIGVGSIPPNVIIFIMLHTSYAHQFIQTPYYIRKDWYMPFTVVWQICTLNTTYEHTTINSWR